ncbi:ClpV [Enterobacter hormaechei]|nr:ClpV [Enterobacter hormaechei]
MENPAILLRRLNPYCARAMEGAASLCQTRAHAEILPEHWLLKLLEQGEGDLTVLARRYEWDMDTIWQDMLGFLDSLPRSVRSRPQLSEGVQSLMQDAWLHASLSGEEHIRSIHLLMALVEKPKLLRCDGLWPLLTLAQSQLESLRGLLDAQSDERPEVQQEAELTQGDEVEFVGHPVNADIKGELNPALQNALVALESDLITMIPALYLLNQQVTDQVHLFELPFKSRRIMVSQMWHPRMERDPGHRWLREQILAICGVERSDIISGSV